MSAQVFPNVARLHGQELDFGLGAKGVLEDRDEPHQGFGPIVADVVHRCRWGLVIVARRPVEAGDDTGHDIVNVGEVAAHIAFVEDLDRFAGEDLTGENKCGPCRAGPTVRRR